MLTDQLYDMINAQLQSAEFSLSITVDACGSTPPPRREVITPLRGWLASLDPDVEEARLAGGSDVSLLPLSFAGWDLEFAAWPIAAEHRGQAGRILSSVSEGASSLNDVAPLRRKIRKKARHYGQLEHPFVIAVLCGGTFVNDDDIGRALLGTSVYRYDTTADQIRGYRQRNGAWMWANGPVNKRNSAILTATNLRASSCATVQPTVWTNPWATRPLGLSLPWRRMQATESGEIIEHPAARTAADVLGLAVRWPAAP